MPSNVIRWTASVIAGCLWVGGLFAAQEDSVIVLDVSNSMWGRVDDRPKIEIAREVIGDLLGEWPAGRRIGLVAYGHRRAGDCRDIETLIPVGELNPRAFVSTVNKLVPRGKTPLTAAVRQAAETLRYGDVPATVILVSDGIESCNADPCSLAESLERGGVDFTAHVIGFDIAGVGDKAGLKCLADRTGGKFLTADSAEELTRALEEATEIKAPASAAIRLEALEAEGGKALTASGLRWTLVNLDSEASLLDGSPGGAPVVSLQPGRYLARVVLGAAIGQLEFVVGDDLKPATHQVLLKIHVSLSTVESAEVGAHFEVNWEGPGVSADYLSVATAEADATAYETYVRLNRGSPSKLQAPATPGHYEVRYVDGKQRRVLARAAIEITGVSAEIEAPPTVVIGEDFQVSWRGPGRKGDYLAVAKTDAKAAAYETYARTRQGSPLTLRAPETPGQYEVRYVVGETRTIAGRLPIDVLEAAASLEAPPTAGIGSKVSVIWSGPDNKGDYLTVVNPDDKDRAYGKYVYSRNGSPAKLRMPDKPGTYELRYVTARERRVLARLPIEVTDAGASLEAPPVAPIGAEIKVQWSGPDTDNDYITVAKPDDSDRAYGKYAYTKNGNPAKLRVPEGPGSYELRYVTGQDRRVLARLPIQIEAVGASLDVPPSAGIGAEIKVAWTGPDNRNDYITVAKPDAADRAYGNYVYTKSGTPATLRMPDDPGAYEVRYVTGQERKVLVRLPIDVVAAEVSLEAPPSAAIGATVSVNWTGPANRRDFVTVVPKGADERKSGAYVDTRNPSPAKLRLPEIAGDYEIRYVTGQKRRVLASIPIVVEAVDAGVEAPPKATIGATIDVSWTGPGNKRDFITVVPVGSEQRKAGSSVRTNTGSPAKLLLPDTPGEYEIRYLTGQKRLVLASVPILIQDAVASLTAPPTVKVGERFTVIWIGPDGKRDRIALADAEAPPNKQLSHVRTGAGSPLKLKAPKQAGSYELRYITGQTRRVLTTLPLTVEGP